MLRPGESKEVTFEINEEMLRFYSIAMEMLEFAVNVMQNMFSRICKNSAKKHENCTNGTFFTINTRIEEIV